MKEKNVADHFSETTKNKGKTPPGYAICTNRVIREELADIRFIVRLVFFEYQTVRGAAVHFGMRKELRQFDITTTTTIITTNTTTTTKVR